MLRFKSFIAVIFFSLSIFSLASSAISPVDQVVLLGSSSIANWPKTKHAPLARFGRQVINLGLGSTGTAYVQEMLSRVVELNPKTIILYTGENDIVDLSERADSVASKLIDQLNRFSQLLPSTKVIYISCKPSPSRQDYLEEFKVVNSLVSTFIEKAASANLVYIDVFSPMLDANQFPRVDLYVQNDPLQTDLLHMNDKGYDLWLQLLSQSM